GTNGSRMKSGLQVSGYRDNRHALDIDPQNPSTVYLGTSRGVFKTTNGGATWQAMNSGLSATDVIALAIDPRDSGILYAVTDASPCGVGCELQVNPVFRSTDGGPGWRVLSSVQPEWRVNTLLMVPE